MQLASQLLYRFRGLILRVVLHPNLIMTLLVSAYQTQKPRHNLLQCPAFPQYYHTHQPSQPEPHLLALMQRLSRLLPSLKFLAKIRAGWLRLPSVLRKLLSLSMSRRLKKPCRYYLKLTRCSRARASVYHHQPMVLTLPNRLVLFLAKSQETSVEEKIKQACNWP